MGIKKEDIEKALGDLEGILEEETVSKASEQDLDQPEGSDFDGKNEHMKKKKLSDEAPSPDSSKKSMNSEEFDKGDTMYKKSFTDELPEEIETKIDVSEFLRSLVDHTGQAIDGLRDELAKSEESYHEATTDLAEAVEEVQKSQAKIGVVLKAICERIGIVENAPATTAQATTEVTKSEVAERTFENGQVETAEEPMFKSLDANPNIAKSQMSNALCDLVKSGKATDMDVIGFESGGYIRPELVKELKTVFS